MVPHRFCMLLAQTALGSASATGSILGFHLAMASEGAWKTLDITSYGLCDLVIIRHRGGELADWSVDPFHSCIYKGTVGRWLHRHQDEVEEVSRTLLKHVNLVSEVFPSERIVTGKKTAKAKRGLAPDSSGEHGLVCTMATLVWLLLYLLFPNCLCNSKSRVKKGIAENALRMLGVLVQFAYEGHTVASAMGTAPGMLALQGNAGSCKVRADGTLDMDSTLAAWSKQNAVSIGIRRQSCARCTCEGRFCGRCVVVMEPSYHDPSGSGVECHQGNSDGGIALGQCGLGVFAAWFVQVGY